MEGFARVFSAAARRVRSPLSCYYSHLEPDCFTASAIKVSRLRHALACSRQPWLPARWFDKLTDGELNAARLRQAARAKRVRSRKQQSLLLYDPGSVARYAPEFAVAIRSALGS